MKRFAALIATLVMVSVSLFVRSRIDDNGSGSTSGTGSGTGRAVVVCVTELGDACRRAYGSSSDVRIEDAAVTARSLVKGGAGIDAWVTLSGWPELVGASATGAGAKLDPTAVASTPIVIAAVKERVAKLDCATSAWSCFLQHAGESWTSLGGDATWGTLRVGIPLRQSAVGLMIEASAIEGWAGTADIGTNDAKYDEARTLLARFDSDPNAFDTFVIQFPAHFSAVGALQAQVKHGAGTKADLITTVPLVPPATATAVVVRVGGGRKIDAGKLAMPLQDAGWTTPPTTTTGLPDAGVLFALSGI